MLAEARTQHTDEVDEALLDRFRKASVSPRGLFAYPTGEDGLRGLGYPEELTGRLPESVRACFCGVGNVFEPGLPGPGEHVLDVGCGAGVDAILAALATGPDGSATGLEFSPDMLARAWQNASIAGAANTSFEQGSAENLPFPDACFDVLTSNGVYNLVQRKPAALAEAFRVLKPGGRAVIADQVLAPHSMPAAGPGEPGSWAR